MISELDTKHFGFTVAKCGVTELKKHEGEKILRAKGVKMCVSRCELNEINDCNWLEKQGFLLKDIQSNYRRNISSDMNFETIKNESDNIKYSIVRAENVDEVMQLAAEAFSGYGHYAADDRLESDLCRDIYVDWAKHSVLDKKVATKVFGAFVGSKLVGMLSLLSCRTETGVHYAKGIMGAVLKEFRNQGVFKNIILNSLQWGKEEKHAWHEHNVLVNNISVNQAFIKFGFVPVKYFATFHWWSS